MDNKVQIFSNGNIYLPANETPSDSYIIAKLDAEIKKERERRLIAEQRIGELTPNPLFGYLS